MREEEKKQTSRKSKFQRILKKRWALPAIYIASAAIILAAALIVQNGFNDSANPAKESATGKNFKEPAIEVNSKLENIKMPVTDSEAMVIKKPFYDAENGTKEEQEAALVSYNNRYEPNKGLDIAMEDGKTFNVVASLSGIVKNVKEDALLGNEITIEHDNGVVTHYQSVKDIEVAVGDEVKQGQALAKAGKSLLNEEAGVHVHFEIRKDNVALNPIDLVEKQLSSIEEMTEKAAEDDVEEPATEDKATEEEAVKSSDEKSTENESGQPSDENADEEKDAESDTNPEQPEDSVQQPEEDSDTTKDTEDSTQN